jgi:hypothetical protein
MATSSPPASFELLEQADAYAVATWRRLMLLVWLSQASAAGIARSQALFEAWAKRHPQGAALLVVIPGQLTRPPDEEARSAMQRTAAAPEGPFRGMATLIEAEGFIAATVRSIMTRIQGGRPARVFGNAHDAAVWAAALLEDPELTPDGLSGAIGAARQRS